MLVYVSLGLVVLLVVLLVVRLSLVVYLSLVVLFVVRLDVRGINLFRARPRYLILAVVRTHRIAATDGPDFAIVLAANAVGVYISLDLGEELIPGRATTASLATIGRFRIRVMNVPGKIRESRHPQSAREKCCKK